MDPVTAIGLAGTIIQFVAYGNTVVARLQEYHDSLGEVPRALRDIKLVLPLLLDALSRTEQQARTTSVTTATEEALTPVIKGCCSQVESLDAILEKLLPMKEDSAFRKGKKAISSVHQEKCIAKIVQKLRDYIQVLTFHQTTLPTSQPTLSAPARHVFNVPFDRDDEFVGRIAILEQVDTKLGLHRRVALSGVGGVGKSQLAIESCYRFREKNRDRHVVWIHASSSARFTMSYQEVAKTLALPGHDDPKVDIVWLVNEWLAGEESGQWLIVLDSVDNLEALATKPSSGTDASARNLAKVISLPRSDHGLIIITTRDMRVGQLELGLSSNIIVPPMEPVEATALLNKQISLTHAVDAKETRELLEQLGFLPLAITQATAFINQNSISVQDYLEILASDSADVQDLFEEDLDLENFVRSDPCQKPRAAEMISLMSHLDRQAIPKDLLVSKTDRLVEVTTSLATLRAFSLVSVGADGVTYELHRLVQLATQAWLQVQAEAQKWQAEALLVVAQAFPLGEFENWPACAKLIPHSLVVCEYSPADQESSVQLALLLTKRAWHDRKQGRFKNAEDNAVKVLQLRKQIFGEQHLATLESTAVLAGVYYEQSRLNEAVNLQMKVLEGMKQIHSAEHRSVIRSMHDLALMYKSQMQLEEAEKLYEQVLEAEKKVLGEEHPETLVTANNLAVTYWSQKRIDEAEKLQVQVWEARRRVLGAEHPHTLMTAQNLASTFWKQNRFDEAEKIQLQVRQTLMKVVGEEHPQTLLTAHNLAMTYWKQDRLIEAETLLTHIIEKRQKILGAMHSHTVTSIEGLEVVRDELRAKQVVDDASRVAESLP